MRTAPCLPLVLLLTAPSLAAPRLAPSRLAGDPLEQRLLAGIDMGRGAPRERELLQDAVHEMLKSKLCHRLAEEFLALGGHAGLDFGRIPGAQASHYMGRQVMLGNLASAVTDGDRTDVTLSDLCLGRCGTDLDLLLAHELLGHGLADLKARRAGLEDVFAAHSVLGEAYAELVSGIAAEETGRGDAFDPSFADALLNGTQEERDRAMFEGPTYALLLSPEEMTDPYPEFRRRLARVERRIVWVSQKLDHGSIWKARIDHLVKAHGVDNRRLFNCLSSIYHYRDRHGKTDLPVLSEARDQLQRLVDAADKPAGRRLSDRLKRAARNPFLQTLAVDVKRLKDLALALRDRRLPPGRFRPRVHVPQQEPAVVNGAAQLTWPELEQMYADDVAQNPKHAIDKP